MNITEFCALKTDAERGRASGIPECCIAHFSIAIGPHPYTGWDYIPCPGCFTAFCIAPLTYHLNEGEITGYRRTPEVERALRLRVVPKRANKPS